MTDFLIQTAAVFSGIMLCVLILAIANWLELI